MDSSDKSIVFSFDVLQNITDNFSHEKLVGSGANGKVYKAPYNDREIAVKRLHPLQGLDDKAFGNELRSLGQIRHQNVVQLVGYCHESRRVFIPHRGQLITAWEMERILCFEYVQGRSLDKHITDDFCDLDWPICYKIIRGTCEGLNHLHNALGRPIYHLDLKPANILLDKDSTPKIADLGLCRIVMPTEVHHKEIRTLQGIFGYMPPEYVENGAISRMFDVYSLGGVIIRIMDGNKCSSRFFDMGTGQFIKHVMDNWGRRLQGKSGFQSHEKGILQAKKCLDIALRCVERKTRPSIKDIVQELEELEAEINKMSLHSDQSKGTVGQTKNIERTKVEMKTKHHNRALNDLKLMLLDETAKPNALPLSLLQDITNGFSEDQIIGTGGFATVYKAILDNGSSVAVKRIVETVLDDEKVHREIISLTKAKHKNIVRFLGYCVEKHGEMTSHNGKLIIAYLQHRLLCFEYLSKGSLSNYITDGSSGLDWRMRYQIIKGICQGLHYLHASHILHLDLNPSNILLNDNMVPKIAGFDISRCFEEDLMDSDQHIEKNIVGTLGYIAPEYFESGKHTIYSDIFSLGVVILDILSGGKRGNDVQTVLKSWSSRLEKPSKDIKLEQIRVCADIALQCCEFNPTKRPVTQHIINRLEKTETTDEVLEETAETTDEDRPAIAWTDTAAMEGPVTASLGPMAPLIQKVRSLKSIEGASENDIKHFKKHLEVLCRDLLEPEETSSMPKWWRKEVRELLYDTEDRLDEAGGDFSELLAVVEDGCKRRERFEQVFPNPGEIQPNVVCVTPESPLLKPSMPNSTGRCIVGIEELMDRLVKQLAFDDHNQKQLKVVPILGFPGVGTTTAAGTLYHEYKGKFQCSAFVRVSRTPDMRSLLISTLLQIKAPRLCAIPGVHDIIDAITKHLEGKRYLIILDGLWTASVWDIIRRVFPDGNYGSRIVTTTQINDVALACCGYYPNFIKMSPLNDDQSRRLFFTIVFGSEDGCPSGFEEVSYKIISKCAGLPLAIVNVASLLGRESNPAVEKWVHIEDSLPSILCTNPNTTNKGMNDFSSDGVIGSEGSQLARGTEVEKWKRTQDTLCSTLEGLKQVLSLIYNNFPPHLKTCLLYLSMYPEGYLIKKHDLVRQWVAEGFVNTVGGRSEEDVAGDYFDQLVSSGMVQPVDTKYGSEVLSCTVHHMVLDLIRHKSKEMNFIITVDYLQSWLALPEAVDCPSSSEV